MTKRLAEELSHTLTVCSTLCDEVEGKYKATFKKHIWYDHASEDILSSGNPAEYSSSMFESHYRLMKIGIHVGNTRSPAKSSYGLHCFRLLIAEEIKHRVNDGDDLVKKELDSILDKDNDGAPTVFKNKMNSRSPPPDFDDCESEPSITYRWDPFCQQQSPGDALLASDYLEAAGTSASSAGTSANSAENRKEYLEIGAPQEFGSVFGRVAKQRRVRAEQLKVSSQTNKATSSSGSKDKLQCVRKRSSPIDSAEIFDQLLEKHKRAKLADAAIIGSFKMKEVHISEVMDLAVELEQSNPAAFKVIRALTPFLAQTKATTDKCDSTVESLKTLRLRVYNSQKERKAKRIHGFGASDPPQSGAFYLKPNEICKGGDLRDLYTRLKSTRQVLSDSQEISFFNCFVYSIVREFYHPHMWERITVRERARHNDNVEIDKDAIIAFVRAVFESNGIRLEKTFDHDVFDMLKVALINFRRQVRGRVLESDKSASSTACFETSDVNVMSVDPEDTNVCGSKEDVENVPP
ncbi:hypothetical protein OESDEN_07402 [Oesophagostomum dentatum]|uniref:Uncharacterized protein n=1 Tax=Oesophagostomum dentatum TaxID=61180 RepID=A0A0B1T658_OESDE|nr:hypothetical protein OESDEN_07402 [Oesophagostomum dentatum]